MGIIERRKHRELRRDEDGDGDINVPLYDKWPVKHTTV